jgi:hypothetical protein
VDAQNSFYSSTNGVLFDNGQTTLIQYPTGKSGSYTVPGSVTNIGDNAFNACDELTDLTIPGSVASIGEDAFMLCTLSNVALASGLISIGEDAFSYCYNLSSITIPGSVTNIGDDAISNCGKLTAIMVEATNAYYSSTDGVLFDKNQTTLIAAPGALSGSYTIPGSVTTIADTAFESCTNLTSVTIPNSVTDIEGDAFYGCSSLTSVTIPGGVTNIGEGAFQNCSGLTSAAIAGGVTSIGASAFASCYSMTSLTMAGSVTNLGDSAFSFCNKLTSVYFGGNAPSVGSFAFYADDDATVYYLLGATGWSSPFAGLRAELWDPLIEVGGANFGVRSNQFGFNITGDDGIPIVVEACTNLANPVWTPLRTVTLVSGSFYFSDPQWTNYPGRFYRISSP